MSILRSHRLGRLVSILISLLAVVLFTLPVWAYLFSAPITVTETNGTAYPMLALQDTLPTTWLVNHGYIGADARDTAIVPTRPHMVTDTNLWVATPLPANGQVNLNLTTGNTPASMDIITGHNGYITTLEDVALRLGNKFSIEWDGWVDTSAGANKDLVLKTGSYRVYVSAANTITATFTGGATTEQLAPNGVGSETNIDILVGAATNWQANLTNDGDTSYVQNNGFFRDLYATTNSSVGAGTITSVAVYIVAERTAAGGTANCCVRTNGVSFTGATNHALTLNYATYSETWVNNPQSGAAWMWAEVDAMEIGVKLAGSIDDRCTQVYAVVSYVPIPVVSITPVPSGDYTVKSYCDGTWFMLSLDGDTSWDTIHSNRVASGGATVAITAADWTIDQNNVMPYMTYYKHSVDVGAGLVLITHYQPNNIIHGTAYAVGTVTVTNGDATVTGAGGAAWTAAMNGSVFKSADGLYYTVDTVTGGTTLELTAVYAGGTLGGQVYNMYPLLPDLVAPTQNGAITFGANPAGTAMAVGNLSGYSGSFADTTTDTPLDRLPEVPVSDWYGDNTVTKAATLANPIRPFVTFVSDNTSLSEILVWRWYGAMLLIASAAGIAKLARRHQGITAIATGAIIALLIAFDSSIFPLYLAVLSAGLIIGGLISERSHSL